MGTNFFSGGLTTVNETGGELISLPRGSQVVPNNILKNAFTAPQRGGTAGQVTNYNTTVNANDAVLTTTVQRWIQEANVGAVTAANKVTTRGINEKSRNTLGRR